MKVLVLGLGNLLMQDDAFGIRTVAELRRRYALPAVVEVLDGGTLGLDLLPRLEGVRRLLIFDAIEMGSPPGTVFRLAGEEVPHAFARKLSVHQMGVQDLLAVAELQGYLPAEIVVWGVQPVALGLGLELTPAVTAAMQMVIEGAVRELEEWGIPLSGRLKIIRGK